MVHVRVLVPAMCLLGGCALVFPIIEDAGTDASSDTDAAVNLVTNGSFEQSASPCGPTWSADNSVILSFAPGFDGGRACVVCSPNNGAGIRQTLNIPLDGGEKFTFSAEVARAADGGSNKAELIARFQYAEGGMSPAYTSTLVDSGAWLYMQES